jgi:putative two-component system response regulator
MATLPDQTNHQALLDNRTILVVDDEESIRRLLTYLLQSHGYLVECAGDAGGSTEVGRSTICLDAL